MSAEKTVNLLWNCANELTTQTHAERLLKSYYINTCRKLARHNVQLPEESVGPARMCARCGNQWCDGNYRLQLQPQRLANNAKRRRQIAQLDTVKAKRERGTMSTAARKRAKWLKKRMVSHMALDCEFCGHKTMLPLEKPKKRTKTESKQTMVAATTTTTTTITKAERKKKNQNIDVNAGLKLHQQQQHKNVPTAPSTATTTKTQPSTVQSNKKKKKKQKSKAATATPAAAPTTQKVQSKTQKQNALLQLAAQLKMHASKNASKTPQNRLQAFLK